MAGSLYESPRRIESIGDCNFYHSTDIPGVGIVEGQWDLRGGVAEYLGHHDFSDERVLEIGPATGFLTFHIEQTAREVVAVEPPMDRRFWNAVPYENLGLARRDPERWTESEEEFFEHIQRIRNGFWFCHERFGSSARVFHGQSESLPNALGRFDTAVLASILLHARSPVSILESCAGLVDKTMIITEKHCPELGDEAVCALVPTVENNAWDTWWRFTPRFFTQFLEVLGFTNHHVTLHKQTASEQVLDMFTVVAKREVE